MRGRPVPQLLKHGLEPRPNALRSKLNDPSATGEPEDQLRGPLENLIADLNRLIGRAAAGVTVIGEVRIPELMTRPDYAVTRGGLIGFIELKAPNRRSAYRELAQARTQNPETHERDQLPTVVATQLSQT